MSTEGCVLNHTRDIDCNREYKKRASYTHTCAHTHTHNHTTHQLMEIVNTTSLFHHQQHLRKERLDQALRAFHNFLSDQTLM